MLSRFFLERPVFAWVIAIILMLAGALAIYNLPVSQYPPIAPPSIAVDAFYPGASAKTVEDSVTQIILRRRPRIETGQKPLFAVTQTKIGRCFLRGIRGFTQQRAGKNPIEPETLFAASGVHADPASKLAVNGFPALRQIQRGVLARTGGVRKDDSRGCIARRIVIRRKQSFRGWHAAVARGDDPRCPCRTDEFDSWGPKKTCSAW